MSLQAIDFERVQTNVEGGTVTSMVIETGFMGECDVLLTVEHKDAPTVLMRLTLQPGTMIVCDPLPHSSHESPAPLKASEGQPWSRNNPGNLCHTIDIYGHPHSVAVCGAYIAGDEPTCCDGHYNCGRPPCPECDEKVAT